MNSPAGLATAVFGHLMAFETSSACGNAGGAYIAPCLPFLEFLISFITVIVVR
jgi:hypothetical protein